MFYTPTASAVYYGQKSLLKYVRILILIFCFFFFLVYPEENTTRRFTRL